MPNFSEWILFEFMTQLPSLQELLVTVSWQNVIKNRFKMKFIFFRVEIQLCYFICVSCPPLVELKINNNFYLSQLCPVFTMNVFVCYSILVFYKDRLPPIRIFSPMMVWKLLRKCFRWGYTRRIKKDSGKVWITVNQNLVEMLSLKVVWTTNT